MSLPTHLDMVSSHMAVLEDLPEHRAAVKEACLSCGVFPIGMEHLPARDATGITVSLEMVEQADIYLGIYAWRYGWVPDGKDISITEMEFDHAVERHWSLPTGSDNRARVTRTMAVHHPLVPISTDSDGRAVGYQFNPMLDQPALDGVHPALHAVPRGQE